MTAIEARLPIGLRRVPIAALLAMAVLAFSLTACNSGSKTLLEADPGAVPLAPTYEMVHAVLDRNCAPCHHSGGDDSPRGRVLLEDDYDYASCGGIVSGLGGLFDTAINGSSMPPGAWPRLTPEEKLLIQRWADQGACAPCRSCP